MNQRSVLVTGCSTGIGYVCAQGLKARGYRVFATARQEKDLRRLRDEGLEAIALDYRDSASVQACAAEVSRLTGGTLYGLFNNGAYGQPGAVEDITRKVMEEQFAANFFGWHELTTLCLPMMRKLGEGRIVQCSSVLGIMAFKWRGPYNAAKFALEGLTDTMRLELAPTQIRVVTINPGPIESDFVKNAHAAFLRNVDRSNTHYSAEYKGQLARFQRGGNNRFKLPAEAVLDKLILALEKPNPAAHYYVTTPTYVAALARRFLPQGLIDRFVHRYSN
ncbi:MAG: SDR family NAD(P)-dependent oxidoreductase [Proteobacteria bacterium]|nr:SDR family NAD(P)-dependent oxidoreductase [Pseudomonadota bacterium]